MTVPPNVHVWPAGTAGAEVALGETPRQSLLGAEPQWTFFASSSFWLARNVAVESWLPLWTDALEYGITDKSVTNAMMMIIAARSTSGSVKPASFRSARIFVDTCAFANMCEMLCNGGAPSQTLASPLERRAFTAIALRRAGQFPTSASDNKRDPGADLSTDSPRRDDAPSLGQVLLQAIVR